MALFFDADWFDARLSERGLGRAAMAAVGGLSDQQLAEVFKDQRMLKAGQVAAFAELLGVTPAEIAERAGVATPMPGQDMGQRIATLEARVEALERALRVWSS